MTWQLQEEMPQRGKELKLKVNNLEKIVSQYENRLKSIENELQKNKDSINFLQSVFRNTEANKELKAKNIELLSKLEKMKTILMAP